MKKILYILIILTMISCNRKGNVDHIVYPETKKVDQINNYFGQDIPDPYAWLENDTSAEVGEWVDLQIKLSRNYLDSLSYLPKIRERLTKLWNYTRYGVPIRGGDNYFFLKNDGLQPQSVLYIMRGLDAESEVFLDPNELSDDGTVALSTYSVSNDGRYFTYGIARSGSDWNEFYVKEVATNTLLNDHLKWIKFSGIAWYKDGFFYSRFDEPKGGSELSSQNKNHKIFYHKIGTSQQNDVLIFADAHHPLRSYTADVTDDERFLIIYGHESTNGNSIRYKKLSEGENQFIVLDEGFENEIYVVSNINDSLLIRTNKEAENYRLVTVDTKSDDLAFQNLIPQQDYPLQSVSIAGKRILATFMKDAANKAYSYNLKGELQGEISLPGPGTISGFSAKQDDTLAFYAFTSFTYPSTIFKFDITANKSEIYRSAELGIRLSDFESKQVFFTSKDGTKVPMFLTYKKGIKLSGENPVMLYGYGGFNVSLTPFFSISNLVFLENGGIFAVVNLRGGGEYGESWHKAGMRQNKQNVFDDFFAAAEFLIKEKYTNSSRLAIRGGSNGGLLVGACMTQRPELFKVAIPEVGVLDMLKFHKFTIGHHWVDEYGSSDEKEQFEYLVKYSPLHNVKAGVEYPATLVTTADHDDRVVPAHSFKFIATLQEHQKSENPVLIRIEKKAGHGAGMPVQKVIDEMADIWAFVFKNLEIKPNY